MKVSMDMLNKFLESNGFNIEINEAITSTNKQDQTPIQQAAYNKEWDIVIQLAQLIQKTENLEDKTNTGDALCRAARNDRSDVVDELLKIKNIRFTWYTPTSEKSGFFALHHAIDNNNLVMAEQLICSSFDVNKRYDINRKLSPAPIEVALENGNSSAVRLLMKHHVDLTPVLKNNKFKLDGFIADIITHAIFTLNETKQRNYTLDSKKITQLQNSIIKSLCSNELFITNNTLLFTNDIECIIKKDAIIKNIADYIARNILKPKITTSLNFFKLLESLDLAPHHEIEQSIINESFTQNSNDYKPISSTLNSQKNSLEQSKYTDTIFPEMNIKSDTQDNFFSENDDFSDETNPLLNKNY